MTMQGLHAALLLTGLLLASATTGGSAKAKATAPQPGTLGRGLTHSGEIPRPREDSAHPSFSGRWTLDMKQSEFGTLPGARPLARTDTITHREPDVSHVLHLVNPTSLDTTVYRYRTTGEVTHSTVDGRDVQSVARWAGRALVIDSKMKMMIFDVTLNDRWELSANRDTLKMTRRVKSPLGNSDQRLVFARR